MPNEDRRTMAFYFFQALLLLFVPPLALAWYFKVMIVAMCVP
jgi:hypothetical protein